MQRWIGPVAGAAAIVAVLLAAPSASLAWGPEAHRAIALFADQLLQQSDSGAHKKLQALLATDKANKLTKNDIAGEAVWADVLREKSQEAHDATSAWHSTRLNPDSPNLATACFGRQPLPVGYPASHGPRDNCSVDKILQFEAELKNPETSSFERLAAVQYLLNLVGDLHDPLHAIDRGDQGGYCIAIAVGDKPPIRLSQYWETQLAGDVLGSDPAKGAARLAAAAPSAEAQKWLAGNPESWAQETFEIAKGVAYGFAAEPAGKHTFPPVRGQSDPCASVNLYKVGPDYETKALAAARMQLAKAGVRLAGILRDGFK